MSIAAFATPGILAPFQAFFHWLVTDAIPLVRPPVPQRSEHSPKDQLDENSIVKLNQTRTRLTANDQRLLTRAASPCAASKRPVMPTLGKPTSVVRMVRVIEAGQAPTNAGRMVISGRMADVCAELDRLASREATHHL